MTQFSNRIALLAAGACLAAMATPALAQPADIFIGNEGEHPESITSTRDGTIFVGGMGTSTVYKAEPGATVVTPFITEGLQMVVGVFAHGGTLWVCSSSGFGEEGPTYANSYDIATGELTGSYEFPGGGFCNDFAVGRDGSVYVADTTGARILVLRPDAEELEVFHEDADLLAGVDGLGILDGELIANSVTTNRLFLIDITESYNFGGITEMSLSQPVEGPDGMRTLPTDDGLLMVEGNRLVRVTVNGAQANIEVLADGFEGATAVTLVGDTAYVSEAKVNYLFDPSLGDPGEFNARAVQIGE